MGVKYPVESLTDRERALVGPHVGNLDQPVFALVNLPETVKGALFARYSRYQGTLRRLMLDEFRETLGGEGHRWERDEGTRAAALYERVFVGYGDDSVAQLGGAHVACEWCSNVLTKLLQRPRLAAYLEQSTRYIAYDAPMPGGGYRYLREPELGPRYERAMDELFKTYSEALERMTAWVGETYAAAPNEPPVARARAVRAKALDLLRGLLPAASLSHMGIYATGQTYEHLIMHLMAHPLPEARRYGGMLLEAVQTVMPSFVSRVARSERGGLWIEFLAQREAAAERWARRMGLDGPEDDPDGGTGPSVRLVSWWGDEREMLAALVFEATHRPGAAVLNAVDALREDDQVRLLSELAGGRENRRHKPGRGLEALGYRFEVVADYGAFRDLQRHRILTVQWQTLTPYLGADVPEEVDRAGLGQSYRHALEVSRAEWERLHDGGHEELALYALCLGYRIRFVLDLNAREAMHLIELRSGVQGHPSYRAVAHEMHRLIGTVHPRVAAAMTHLDHETEPRLERLLSEIRSARRSGESA